MKRYPFLVCFLLFFSSSFLLGALGEELEGKQFFYSDGRGNNYYYLFANDGSYVRETPEVGYEMGNWFVRPDGNRPLLQLYPQGMSPSRVRRSSDHNYHYTLTSGVITFYADEALVGVFFPHYWTLLQADYTSSSEDKSRDKDSRFYSHYVSNLYHPQTPGLQNLRWFWSESDDAVSSPDRFIRVTFPTNETEASSNRDDGSYVKGAVIFNGCFFSEEEYRKRSRLKEGLVLLVPGGMKTVTLEDTPDPQVVLFDGLEEPVTELTLYVQQVYSGSESRAVHATRVIFFGLPAD